jgi:hypothetical protein
MLYCGVGCAASACASSLCVDGYASSRALPGIVALCRRYCASSRMRRHCASSLLTSRPE